MRRACEELTNEISKRERDKEKERERTRETERAREREREREGEKCFEFVMSSRTKSSHS